MAASILVLGAALAAAPAAGSHDRFRDVKEWSGTVTITKNGGGEAVGPQVKTEFTLAESLSLSFTLRRDPESSKNRPRWIGTVEGGNASIQETFKMSSVKDGAVIQSSTCSGNQLQGRDVALTMNLRDGTYDLRFPDEVNYVCQSTMNGRPIPEKPGFTDLLPIAKIPPEEAATVYSPEGVERYAGYLGKSPRPLPASSTTLSGSKTFDAMPNSHTMLAMWASIPATVAWSIDGDAKPLELVVDPEGYDGWRPLPGPDEVTPAGDNKLPIKATLQLRGGGEPPVKAKTFTFTLVEVSKEPGIAMNFPRAPSAPRPDLRFENAAGFTVSDEGVKAVRTGTPATTATASLASYDGGGWGVLTVTAILEDDREVKGHLRSQPGVERILLPKRDQRSRISDHWKASTGARGDDGDDREVTPSAMGTRGTASPSTRSTAASSRTGSGSAETRRRRISSSVTRWVGRRSRGSTCSSALLVSSFITGTTCRVLPRTSARSASRGSRTSRCARLPRVFTTPAAA